MVINKVSVNFLYRFFVFFLVCEKTIDYRFYIRNVFLIDAYADNVSQRNFYGLNPDLFPVRVFALGLGVNENRGAFGRKTKFRTYARPVGYYDIR